MAPQHRAATAKAKREREELLEDTLERIRAGKFESIGKAVRETGFPKTTLHRRLHGAKPRIKAQEEKQNLTEVEENELARWITLCTVSGRAPIPEVVREMAEGIRRRHVKGVNESGMELVSYEPIGKRWVGRFLNRFPHLQTERGKKIEAVRMEASEEDYRDYFEKLRAAINEFEVSPENVYNMDETGFNIGVAEDRNVIVDGTVSTRYQAQGGRQEWVTSVDCICADGSSIPPLIIFTGASIMSNWIPRDFDTSWKLHYNTKGWTSREHGMHWLRECFEPMTREKANGKYRLLILDRHDSHCTPEFLAHTMEHKILAFALVPHTSHICQPLDNSIFGPLKRVLSGELNRLFHLGITRVQKWEWLAAYYSAHQKVFNYNNIMSGFSSTGIYPCNPDKVFNRLPKPRTSTPPAESDCIPSIPSTTMQFDLDALTSSPVDFLALRSNNSTLHTLLRDFAPGLPSEAKQYIRCITSAAEKLYAQNSLLNEQVRQQSEALGKRKEVANGKRIALRNERLLSTPDVYQKVLAADNATKAKKSRKSASTNNPLATTDSNIPIDPQLYTTLVPTTVDPVGSEEFDEIVVLSRVN